MSAELPLKIRLDIRDLWDSPEGEIQKSVDALTKTLGHKIAPHVQWPLFYSELKETYADKGSFVPAVIRVVTVFYDRLLARLEDEGNSEWTDQLLEELAKKPADSWLLQIEAYNGSRPRAAMKANFGEFTLEIPSRDLPMNASVQAGFDQDFDHFFLASEAPLTSVAVANDDEWAEVIPGYETRSTSQPAVVFPTIILRPRELPTVERLGRPAELFKNTTPYTLRVDARHSPLIVQGSHQPSLDLLVSYLKKWAKANMNDSQKRPLLKITPIESAFVFGVIDGIEIEFVSGTVNPKPLNPAIILAFVEGVLGYKETHTTGTIWTFKLETPLK